MEFWWITFVSNMLLPATMIIAGYLMWKHCPAKISPYLGYRTRRSMKNINTWKFAHDYIGRLWWKLGWVIIIPTVLAQLPFTKSGETTITNVSVVILMVQAAVMLLSIIPTENALKNEFENNKKSR